MIPKGACIAPWISPDRDEIIKREYAAGTRQKVIRQMLVDARPDLPPCPSKDSLISRANRLGVFRSAVNPAFVARVQKAARDGIAAKAAGLWQDRAPKFREYVAAGMHVQAIAKATGLNEKTVRNSLAKLKLRAAPHPKAPRHAAAQPERRVTPRATYQTVEDWLAAGNRITRCPAAVVWPSSYTPTPEDAAALSAYYARDKAALAKAGGNRWRLARQVEWAPKHGA